MKIVWVIYHGTYEFPVCCFTSYERAKDFCDKYPDENLSFYECEVDNDNVSPF